MPDLQITPSAEWAPSVCFICRRSYGAMIDTFVETSEGRMYICTWVCAPKIAALVGLVEQPKPKCSAVKTNGEPCTADALSGYEVCVAHLKAKRDKEEEDALVEVRG